MSFYFSSKDPYYVLGVERTEEYDKIKDLFGPTSGSDALWKEYTLASSFGDSAKAKEILSRIDLEYPASLNSNNQNAKTLLSSEFKETISN